MKAITQWRRCTLIAILTLLTVFLPGQTVQAKTNGIGWVQEVKGNVTLTAKGQTKPAKVNTAVNNGDMVKTGANSRVQIMFVDRTTMALGAESHLQINNVVYNPNNKASGQFHVKFLRGTFGVLVGKLRSLMNIEPDRFKFDSPLGVLGIRGTEFASMVNQGREFHALVEGGPVAVTATTFSGGASAADPALCKQIKSTITEYKKAISVARRYNETNSANKLQKKMQAVLKVKAENKCR